jgi:hypothetical protein
VLGKQMRGIVCPLSCGSDGRPLKLLQSDFLQAFFADDLAVCNLGDAGPMLVSFF